MTHETWESEVSTKAVLGPSALSVSGVALKMNANTRHLPPSLDPLPASEHPGQVTLL